MALYVLNYAIRDSSASVCVCVICTQVPAALALGPLTTLGAAAGQAPRLGKGIQYRNSRKPDEPLEIW